jgi:hypothetical protein
MVTSTQRVGKLYHLSLPLLLAHLASNYVLIFRRCHEPHAFRRGACSCTPSQLDILASTASSSLYATSESEDSGRHDKAPVLPHRGTEYLRERNVFTMNAVLPWQCVHFYTAFQEPVTFFRLRATTVSLCVVQNNHVPQHARAWTSECLLASTYLFFLLS